MGERIGDRGWLRLEVLFGDGPVQRAAVAEDEVDLQQFSAWFSNSSA